MPSIWVYLLVFGVLLATMPKGTDGNKRDHIIQALLAGMRKGSSEGIVKQDTGKELKTSDFDNIPFYSTQLANENGFADIRSVLMNTPGILLEGAVPSMDSNREQNMADRRINGPKRQRFMNNGLERYIIKKVKREPEDFPMEMYPAQGGKQQLEVDLDNELNKAENEMIEKEGEMVGDMHNDLIEDESELNGNENNLDADNRELNVNEDEIDNQDVEEVSQERMRTGMFPADIIISGADLSAIKPQSGVERPSEAILDEELRRKRSFHKRFWAANQLYRLRTPKSHWNRTHRMRTALPRFDPILYFIGLGK